MIELKVNIVFLEYDYKVILCNFKTFILWELNVKNCDFAHVVLHHMNANCQYFFTYGTNWNPFFLRWCVNIELLVMDLDLFVVGLDLLFEAQYHWMLLLKWCLNLVLEFVLANHSLFISFMDDISSFPCDFILFFKCGLTCKKRFFEVACGVFIHCVR